MKLVSDESSAMTVEYFRLYFYYSRMWPMVNIVRKILESLDTNFMNSPLNVFDVDHVAIIRSELWKN